jgi:hypothetical protein
MATPHDAADTVAGACSTSTVKQYAEIAACLRCAPPERAEEVIVQHGLAPSDWTAMAVACARAIEEERALGKHELLLVYADTFTATRKGLVSPALPVPGPAPEAPAPPVVLATFQRSESVAASPARARPTMKIDVRQVMSASLPFSPPLEGLEDSAPAMARKTTPPAARKPGRTLDVDARALIKSALPFMNRSAPADPGSTDPLDVTLTRHASICAELSVSPARTEDTLAKHGIAPGSFDAYDASCRARLAADPDLSQRWQAQYARHRAWFLIAGGGK